MTMTPLLSRCWISVFRSTAVLLSLKFVPPSQSFLLVKTQSFDAQTHYYHYDPHPASQLRLSYGRGAEIWPPANEEPVKLVDSFPGGMIPPTAKVLMQNLDADRGKAIEWRKMVPRAIVRILRRAARAQEEDVQDNIPAMDKTPGVVAFVLLFMGYVSPADIAWVVLLSLYFVVLGQAATGVRKDGVTPQLPALPPQGHVPTLIANPLGPSFAYSILYDRWLKLGVGVGLLAPLLTGLYCTLHHQRATAKLVLRPLFVLCCQAVSEAISRRVMTPLPLRILVPVAYNVARLGYLWNWVFAPIALGWMARLLGILNLVYWSVNLFGFLLPIAVMKYMRAHFYCVEAEQVVLRSGMEESVGLLS